MRTLKTLILLGLSQLCFSQSFEYVYKNTNDSSYNCYLTIIPDSIEVLGLLVRDYSALPKPNCNNSSFYKWKDLALENGLAILYTVTSDFFPELYYNDTSLILLYASPQTCQCVPKLRSEFST